MCVVNGTQRDNEREEVRTRLVAREIKRKGTARDCFAGTPPSETKRAFLHADALTETNVGHSSRDLDMVVQGDDLIGCLSN